MRFESGTVFAGYTVVSRLGRGGMATVYLVREPGIERLVALKVLPEHLVDDAQFGARFEHEARLIGGLDHPNIIPLYRYGITDDVPWMALRYVDGGDFAARLAARPLPVAEGLALLRQIASALDYAHRKGVIHRDLKPQNILLTGDGAAYLADFGVAKMLEGSKGLKTATGGVIGTPAYMAPEQARGQQLGAYTDVYALAVVCCQWLTGNLPFDADTPQAILMKHVLDPLPEDVFRTLSPGVAAVIAGGLAKRPEDRIQSATGFISQLERALALPATHLVAPDAAQPTRITPSPLQAVAAPTPAGSRWRKLAIVTVLLAACLGAYGYWRWSLQPVTELAAAKPAAQSDHAVAEQDKGQTQEPVSAATTTKSSAQRQANENVVPAPVPAPPPESIPAALIVKSDTACRLQINGRNAGELQADKARTFNVDPGEQLIQCRAIDSPHATAQLTKTVAAAGQAVVVLALADKSSEKPKIELSSLVGESPEKVLSDAGFVDLGNGLLKDTRTGLQWAQSDNGADIGWNDARKFCAARGSDWRLPSVDELLAIYASNVPTPRVCAVHGALSYTCKTSVLFHLTSTAFWSGTALGAGKSWDVLLFSGLRDAVPVEFAQDIRALCVRGP
jgi:serine/threonine protein kinase